MRSAINACELATVGELSAQLADGLGVPESKARDVVESAMSAGVIEEENNGSIFLELRVVETDETAARDTHSNGGGSEEFQGRRRTV